MCNQCNCNKEGFYQLCFESNDKAHMTTKIVKGYKNIGNLIFNVFKSKDYVYSETESNVTFTVKTINGDINGKVMKLELI